MVSVQIWRSPQRTPRGVEWRSVERGAERTMCELAKRDTFISLRLNRKIIINIILVATSSLLGESLACLQSDFPTFVSGMESLPILPPADGQSLSAGQAVPRF